MEDNNPGEKGKVLYKIQPIQHDKVDNIVELVKSGEMDKGIVIYEVDNEPYIQPLTDSHFHELGWLCFQGALRLFLEEAGFYDEEKEEDEEP